MGHNNEGSHNLGSNNVGSRNIGDFNLCTLCLGHRLTGFGLAGPPALLADEDSHVAPASAGMGPAGSTGIGTGSTFGSSSGVGPGGVVLHGGGGGGSGGAAGGGAEEPTKEEL